MPDQPAVVGPDMECNAADPDQPGSGRQDPWFAKPAGLENQQITVGVLQQEVDSGSLPAFGCWRRLSAEESVIAWFAAAAKAAERVRDGGNDDELQAWLGHCLSCPVLIKVVQDLSETVLTNCFFFPLKEARPPTEPEGGQASYRTK